MEHEQEIMIRVSRKVNLSMQEWMKKLFGKTKSCTAKTEKKKGREKEREEIQTSARELFWNIQSSF